MASVKLPLAIFAIGMAALACAGGGRGQTEAEKARLLLMKTLERTFPQNVLAIIMQKSPDNGNSFQRIQVQISRDGRMRQTVIYPLSMEGMQKIDDGRQIATFLPDDKLLLIQESPRLLPNDSATRINLTMKNYGLKLGGNTTVAGQTATIVIAVPKGKDLETRHYFIDEKTGFLLQLNTLDGSGQTKTAFKVQSVAYPAKLSAQSFVIDQDCKDGRKIVYKRRSNLFSVGKGSLLDFEPVLPANIPLGFELQDAQITEDGNARSVAVRITDGLVKATVYQWPVGKGSKMTAAPGSTIGDSGGLRFAVYADVPEAARRKILSAFIEATRKSAWSSPITGPSGRAELYGSGLAFTQSRAFIQAISQADRPTMILVEVS